MSSRITVHVVIVGWILAAVWQLGVAAIAYGATATTGLSVSAFVISGCTVSSAQTEVSVACQSAALTPLTAARGVALQPASASGDGATRYAVSPLRGTVADTRSSAGKATVTITY